MDDPTKGMILMLDKYDTLFFIGKANNNNGEYQVHQSMKGSPELLFKLIANAVYSQSRKINSNELQIEFKLIRDAINTAEKMLWTKKN